MKKMLCFFRKRKDLSMEEFRKYYETVHVPLALKLLPKFTDHRRSYVLDGSQGDSDATVLPFDVLTEIWFETDLELEALQTRMADPEVSAAIAKDEKHLFDTSATRFVLVDEQATPRAALKAI